MGADDGVGDPTTCAVTSDGNYGCKTIRYGSLGELFFVAGRGGVVGVGDAGAVAEGGLDGRKSGPVAATADGGVNDEAGPRSFRAVQW